jgi:hypothetical protein
MKNYVKPKSIYLPFDNLNLEILMKKNLLFFM